jgi:hypothetical protein
MIEDADHNAVALREEDEMEQSGAFSDLQEDLGASEAHTHTQLVRSIEFICIHIC